MRRTMYLYSSHFKIYKMTSFIIVTIYPFAFGFCALLYFFITSRTKREITQRYGRNTRLNYGDSAFDGFA